MLCRRSQDLLVVIRKVFRSVSPHLKKILQGCWANPDDRGNPDDFLEKNLSLFHVFFSPFFNLRSPKLNLRYKTSIKEDEEAMFGLLKKKIV